MIPSYNNDDYRAMACKSGVEYSATFCSNSSLTGRKYTCACSNVAEFGSWVACGYEHTQINDTGIETAIMNLCPKAKLTHEKIRAAYINATNYMVNISEVADFNASIPVNYPITGGEMTYYFHGVYYGYKNAYNATLYGHYLGWASLAMWGALIVVCGIFNWAFATIPGFRRLFVGAPNNFWRKYITMPALFGKKHIESFGVFGLFPSRFEFIILSLFFIYMVLANAILGVSFYEHDLVFKKPSNGIASYVGDRSAILLCYLFPLLFLFPGRNNFLQWVTRWPYSRFVTFHKGLGRILCLEVLVHSIAMTLQSIHSGKYHKRVHADWYRYGVVATVSCWLAMGLGAYVIRRYWYEVFWITHVILIVMFLWSAWLHAAYLEYGEFYYACAAIWVFDWVARIARVVLFGVRTARCEIMEEEGTIKLSIPYPKGYWKADPAAHGFVYFLGWKTFWHSHPFTLIDSITDKDHIHFYCKIKGGVTKIIGEATKSHHEKVFPIKVLVEGPYGFKTSYQHYDKAVLIAGGNGIPGPFSHALDLASRDTKTEVKLYWGVREYNSLNWFKSELAQFKGTRCKPIIYVSNPSSRVEDVDLGETSSSGSSDHLQDEKSSGNEKTVTLDALQSAFSYVEFRKGRIDIDKLVAEEISESSGSVAFGACAHPNMIDTLRAAVANSQSGSRVIDYFEEMQTW
ncbi:hypothetical protein OGAPHI_004183 [Ogataea philodendri]|uniref:FAD-binding FR-type domain-containing protein n=1 Tax=Ogataea philodendri TaxID=1378263 RepID=A0A9P8P6S7_9ASCO|nr:uncharacterized protein OGAPHI_004183 [Ogataea philodendri]KAH3665994.1 hypothetical protein OGAPHI_004183 [Ogataea philodendri]